MSLAEGKALACVGQRCTLDFYGCGQNTSRFELDVATGTVALAAETVDGDYPVRFALAPAEP